MPEGPEIRRAADAVEKAVVNRPILTVEFGQDHLKHWEYRFPNAQVRAVETYGKAMLTRFDNGLAIYSHNQLYGRWVCCPAGQAPATNRQLRLGIYTADQWALLYSASEIEVLALDQCLQHPFINQLGMDVLSPAITADYVVNRLLSPTYRNRKVGLFLTEQSFLAGLGNYLRCEILFVARIDPDSLPAALKIEQIEALAEAIIELPQRSYRTAGITHEASTAESMMAQGISFEDARFWVFRRAGLACYRCDEKIIQIKSSGQACYCCPGCQLKN